MSPDLVHNEISHGVATITLDSPRNRNALSYQLRTELGTALTTVIAAPDVRVIVLTHTGTTFCAGADLKEVRDDEGHSPSDDFAAIVETIWLSPKPVIARLSGSARAGGLGLVAACDIAVAADSVTFALTEVRIGVVAAVISVTLLPRLASAPANSLFLTGEQFDAARAVEIGLLDSAVPADELDAEVKRFTEMLKLGAPNALAATKALLRESRSVSLKEQLDRMSRLSSAHFASSEGKEGMRAFSEKRSPAWVLEATS